MSIHRRHFHAGLLFFVSMVALVPFATAQSSGSASKGTRPSATKKMSPSDAELFNRDIWPTIKANCIACHAGSSPSGGLSLADRAALLKGGVSGPAIVPGKPEKSLLIQAINYQGRQMPPQGKISQSKIDALTKWVATGANWPKEATAATNATPAHHGPPPVNAETKRFWSFQPVKRPTIPKVKTPTWVHNPIDAFVLSKLEKNGLSPAKPASRATLIRRAYFDMIGLPPTPDEVRAFVSDTSPKAYEKVVDRLLASPHYGERWGRHWLDLVRYAETNSFERDGDKPFVWRYRDYVIRSFNQDKPYSRFLTEQLAGDELPNATPETLIATGYMRLGIWDDEAVDHEQAIFDDLDDIVSTTGQTMLGMTIGCARCHDHKIDPVPQRDYYKILAFFRNVPRYGNRGFESVQAASLLPISNQAEQQRFATETQAFKDKLADLDAKIKTIEDIVRPTFSEVEKQDFENEQNRALIVRLRIPSKVTQSQYESYVDLMEARRDHLAHPPKGLEMALCVSETGRVAPKTFVLARGNAHSPGEEVTPGFLSVVTDAAPTLTQPVSDARTTGRRTALAKWIASDNNPLTSRVMANRLWQFHFGRGIVRSSSNFGFLGTPPTHPELLDYLASELVKGGWRLKPLHKQILLSNAYQMSSQANPIALKKDPENDLLWRFDMRRLEAEEIRDSILTVNGTLNPTMYGPSIKIKLPREVLLGQSVPGQGWDLSSPEEQNRRSIYVKVKRSLAVPILARYDVPDTDSTCPVRFATTQPTQALGMLNSEFLNEQAKIFGDFTRKVIGSDPNLQPQQVRFVLSRTLQREPTTKEIQRGMKLLTDLQRIDKKTPEEALNAFCLLAYNLNEFIYLD